MKCLDKIVKDKEMIKNITKFEIALILVSLEMVREQQKDTM